MRRFVRFTIAIAIMCALSGCAAASTPLVKAAQRGDINSVQALLDKGAAVNEISTLGWEGQGGAALETAAIQGNLE